MICCLSTGCSQSRRCSCRSPQPLPSRSSVGCGRRARPGWPRLPPPPGRTSGCAACWSRSGHSWGGPGTSSWGKPPGRCLWSAGRVWSSGSCSPPGSSCPPPAWWRPSPRTGAGGPASVQSVCGSSHSPPPARSSRSSPGRTPPPWRTPGTGRSPRRAAGAPARRQTPSPGCPRPPWCWRAGRELKRQIGWKFMVATWCIGIFYVPFR